MASPVNPNGFYLSPSAPFTEGNDPTALSGDIPFFSLDGHEPDQQPTHSSSPSSRGHSPSFNVGSLGNETEESGPEDPSSFKECLPEDQFLPPHPAKPILGVPPEPAKLTPPVSPEEVIVKRTRFSVLAPLRAVKAAFKFRPLANVESGGRADSSRLMGIYTQAFTNVREYYEIEEATSIIGRVCYFGLKPLSAVFDAVFNTAFLVVQVVSSVFMMLRTLASQLLPSTYRMEIISTSKNIKSDLSTQLSTTGVSLSNLLTQVLGGFLLNFREPYKNAN